MYMYVCVCVLGGGCCRVVKNASTPVIHSFTCTHSRTNTVVYAYDNRLISAAQICTCTGIYRSHPLVCP